MPGSLGIVTRYWLPLTAVHAVPARVPQSSRRRWSVSTACVDVQYLRDIEKFKHQRGCAEHCWRRPWHCEHARRSTGA